MGVIDDQEAIPCLDSLEGTKDRQNKKICSVGVEVAVGSFLGVRPRLGPETKDGKK